MSEEVKVGNFSKVARRPVPGNNAGSANEPDGIPELNVKMDKLLDLAQAIDWKLWVYLKANNYID